MVMPFKTTYPETGPNGHQIRTMRRLPDVHCWSRLSFGSSKAVLKARAAIWVPGCRQGIEGPVIGGGPTEDLNARILDAASEAQEVRWI